MDWPGPTSTKIAVLCCLSLFCSGTAAQQSPPPIDSCIVIGDVQRPDAYPLPNSAPVSLSQVTKSAGLAAESSFVTIIRATAEPSRWTEIVNRSESRSQTAVLGGDVIIVRGAVAADRAVTPNAAVLAGDHPIVVTLAHSQIAVGELFGELRLPLPPGTTVVRAGSGGPHPGPAVALSDFVQHGDLLAVRSADHRSLGLNRALRHRTSASASADVWSERMGATTDLPTTRSTPKPTDTLTSGTADSGPPVLTVPLTETAEAESGESSGISQETTADFSAAVDTRRSPPRPWTDERASVDADRDVFLPAPAARPAENVVRPTGLDEATAFASGSAAGPSAAAESVQRRDPTDQTAEPGVADSSAADTAATDPSRGGTSGTDTASRADGMSLLNVVFVGGLLLSGGLIIAGWVRSELAASRRTAAECSSATISQSDRASFAAVVRQSSDRETRHRPASRVSQEDSTAAAADIAQHAADRPAAEPSRNPAGPASPPECDQTRTLVVTTASSPVSPPETAGASVAKRPDPTPAESLVRGNEWYGQWHRDSPPHRPAADESHSPVPPPVAPSSKPALSESDSLPGARPSSTTEPVSGDSAARPGAAEPSACLEQPAHPADTLDALICNQVPVEACVADLPRRVTLYGRPAGPQRLRIDAAHRGVPAPHFPAVQSRQSASQPVTQTSSTAPQATEGASPSARETGNSLDRALNSLEGRVTS